MKNFDQIAMLTTTLFFFAACKTNDNNASLASTTQAISAKPWPGLGDSEKIAQWLQGKIFCSYYTNFEHQLYDQIRFTESGKMIGTQFGTLDGIRVVSNGFSRLTLSGDVYEFSSDGKTFKHVGGTTLYKITSNQTPRAIMHIIRYDDLNSVGTEFPILLVDRKEPLFCPKIDPDFATK